MKNRKQESGDRSQKSAWIGLLLALVCAGAVYAGVGVGGGSQIITVDSATQAGIDATVSATNDATRTELLATNALLVAVDAGKVATNAVLDKVAIGDGSVLTNMATLGALNGTNDTLVSSIAGKVTTNAVLDKLQLLDGSSLTNVTANTDLSRAGTNALGGISFVMLDGTNLLAVIGTTTNQVYLAPYSP